VGKPHDHWLVRRTTIRGLWIVFSVVLGATVAAEIIINIKGYSGLDNWPGFAAVFGFFGCVALVLISKVVGRVVKREETYYDDGDPP